MKKLLTLTLTLALGTLIALPVIAHHAAEGMVDDDVYAMIDELVSDTPHATMVIGDLAVGMTELTVTMTNINAMEDLAVGGLFKYMGMLDGETDINIDMNDMRNITMTLIQVTDDSSLNTTGDVIGLDKAAGVEDATWSDIKAQYR